MESEVKRGDTMNCLKCRRFIPNDLGGHRDPENDYLCHTCQSDETIRRCPNCLQLPEIKNGYTALTHEFRIWVSCERHGHVAGGKTEDEALVNWNKYVTFITKDAIAHQIATGADEPKIGLDENPPTLFNKSERVNNEGGDMERTRCPNCRSTLVYFRIRANDFICRTCSNQFEKPKNSKSNQSEKKEDAKQ